MIGIFNIFCKIISKIDTNHEIYFSSGIEENHLDVWDDNFENFFPSKITENELYLKGKFSIDSKIIPHIIKHTKKIFNYSCKPNARVVILIISSPYNYILRKNIRESFGKNNKNFKYENLRKLRNLQHNYSHCLLFSVGYTKDRNINKQIDLESFKNKDLIRIPILEDYRELSHKVILTLHLLNQISTNFEMILKSDDDMFIKINKMIPYLLNVDKNEVILGEILWKSPVIRDPSLKWYVSKEDYPYPVYKPYINGPCYAIRRSIIDEIVKKHYKVKTIPMEDVHISYLIKSAGYKLTDSNRFYFYTNITWAKSSYMLYMGNDIEARNEMLAELQKEYEYND